MNFFFMEMNTRLQVEHPVTEAITGLDLVEWQLRVASGEPLPLKQEQLQHPRPCHRGAHLRREPGQQLPAGHRHAARLPQAGSARRFQRGRVRMDDGVREGDAISPFYDSMIAKLIVHGATRDEALARLDRRAGADAHRRPAAPTCSSCAASCATESFAKANLDTALIERERAVLFDQRAARPAAGRRPRRSPHAARRARHRRRADPFSRRDGWRSHGVTVRASSPSSSVASRRRPTLRYLHDGALTLDVGGASDAVACS